MRPITERICNYKCYEDAYAYCGRWSSDESDRSDAQGEGEYEDGAPRQRRRQHAYAGEWQSFSF